MDFSLRSHCGLFFPTFNALRAVVRISATLRPE
jgi:hypothetical protein